ncbi:hypothetical protein [Paenirhodobacter populi]|uniref:hypothetical protein n=1 Tax=Paenirhodobacter populi TaxID=2306993 RepID=UPI000FE33ED8|nr:hypothetical protein [Sinirhodobacter populi]
MTPNVMSSPAPQMKALKDQIAGGLAAQGVSLTQTDQASLARRMRDTRFVKAVAIECTHA